MAKRNNKTGIRTFGIIVLALILIVGFALIFLRCAGKSNDDYKSFYLSYDGGVYATIDTVGQVPGETRRYNVRYSYGLFSDDRGNKGYSVKVVSNATDETDFSYTVDGKVHSFGKEAIDLSAAFNLDLSAEYFTLTMPYSMQEALQAVYPDSTVIVSDGVDLTQHPYFKLIATAYDKKAHVELYLIAPTLKLGDNLLFY